MSQANNPEDAQRKGTGKKMLLLLAAVFILPFTIAATLHFLDIRPSGKSFGNLISPPIALEFTTLNKVNGGEFTPVRWEKIWSIVMIDDANCAEACLTNVDKLNRVHISLPKEVERIQRVLFLQGDVQQDEIAALQTKFADLIVLTSSNEDQTNFMNTFTDVSPTSSVYLVDPLGNLMMHYPQDVTPKELRADLSRLLKNSWGG